MSPLASQRCAALPKGTAALSAERIRQLLAETPGWSVDEKTGELRREYRFATYAQTVAFANAVGFLAERQDHHPDLLVSWGRCEVRYSTHSVGGLSENDFISAAKIDALLQLTE